MTDLDHHEDVWPSEEIGEQELEHLRANKPLILADTIEIGDLLDAAEEAKPPKTATTVILFDRVVGTDGGPNAIRVRVA